MLRTAFAQPIPLAVTVDPGMVVHSMGLAHTNIDIDDEACASVMRRYHLRTKREAVNFSLRTLAAEPLRLEEARRLRGAGWEGDFDELRGDRPK